MTFRRFIPSIYRIDRFRVKSTHIRQHDRKTIACYLFYCQTAFSIIKSDMASYGDGDIAKIEDGNDVFIATEEFWLNGFFALCAP